MTKAPTAADLTDLFRDFYALLIDLRRRAEADASDLSLEEMREPLAGFLQALRADDERSADAIALREATYVMCAFADELLTGFAWRLRGAWSAAPLESKYFQTNEAGSAIFRRIEQLLAIGDPGQRPLARLYLLALSLGFRGDLEPDSAERSLADFRRRLLELAVPEHGSADPGRSLAPSAYRHTVGRNVTEPLPNLRLWAWVAGAAVLALLVTSHFAWRDATESVASFVEQVVSERRAR